jgi:hypothetical protein
MIKITSIVFSVFLLVNIIYGQYPLNTGNIWEFSNGNFDTTTAYTREVVGDTIMTNGKTYSIIKEVERPPEVSQRYWGRWTKYHRYDSLKVFEYNPRYNDEYLICNFNSKPSTLPIATYINNSDTLDVYLRGKGEKNVFGKTLMQWSFTIDYHRTHTDDELYFIVTDKIGMTLRSGFLFYYPIKGAFIDGMKYGVLSNTLANNDISHNISHYQLFQNYPNPFNPSTTIEFNLPKAEYVMLDVHNITGEKVKTIISANLHAGNHTYEFDGSNLSSGLYFYKLTTETYQETKKMILMK